MNLPKVIQLLSDKAWAQTCFLGSQVTVLPTLLRTSHSLHPPLPWLRAWLRVKPFGLSGCGRKNSCLTSHHVWCRRVGVLRASQAQGVTSAPPPPPATRCPDESELYRDPREAPLKADQAERGAAHEGGRPGRDPWGACRGPPRCG